MLTAILKGKAGRINIDGQDQSWRDVFRQREDLLTAAFFSRILYLSSTNLQKIIATLIGIENAQVLPKLTGYEFWPKFGLNASSYVEPDVVLEFDTTAILIEVKPPFGGTQYSEQWHKEIKAFINDESKFKRLHFVALGRNTIATKNHEMVYKETFEEIDLEIHTPEWKEVVSITNELLNLADGGEYIILKDIYSAFNLFGMVKRNLEFEEIRPLLTISTDWISLFSHIPFQTPTIKIEPLWDSLLMFSQQTVLLTPLTVFCDKNTPNITTQDINWDVFYNYSIKQNITTGVLSL